MSRRITFPGVAMFVSLLSLTPAVSAADRRIQVEASAVQSAITVILLEKSGKAEIRLKDGARLSGTLSGAYASGLQFRVKKGAVPGFREVPYDQLSTIRVDLGPHRRWEAAGAVLGFVGGMAAGIPLGFRASSAAGETAAAALILVSPIIGAKLGGLHRRWLMIEVH